MGKHREKEQRRGQETAWTNRSGLQRIWVIHITQHHPPVPSLTNTQALSNATALVEYFPLTMTTMHDD